MLFKNSNTKFVDFMFETGYFYVYFGYKTNILI